MEEVREGGWWEAGGEGVRGGEVKSCLLLCGVLEGRHGGARGPKKPDSGKREGARPYRAAAPMMTTTVVVTVVVVVVEGGKGERKRDGEDGARERRRERVLLSVDLCVVAWPTWRLALRKVRRADQRGGLEGSTGILVKADSSSFACSRSRAPVFSFGPVIPLYPASTPTPLLRVVLQEVSDPYFFLLSRRNLLTFHKVPPTEVRPNRHFPRRTEIKRVCSSTNSLEFRVYSR